MVFIILGICNAEFVCAICSMLTLIYTLVLFLGNEKKIQAELKFH